MKKNAITETTTSRNEATGQTNRRRTCTMALWSWLRKQKRIGGEIRQPLFIPRSLAMSARMFHDYSLYLDTALNNFTYKNSQTTNDNTHIHTDICFPHRHRVRSRRSVAASTAPRRVSTARNSSARNWLRAHKAKSE